MTVSFVRSTAFASSFLSLLLVIQTKAYTMQDMCALWSGKGYIGNPNDCSGWGYCQNQKLISSGSCANGLIYDSRSGTCEYATKVACFTSVQQSCNALTTPGFMADPTDCTKYAYCFGNGKSEVKSCPTGQTYAANNNSCIWGPSCSQDTACRFMQNNINIGDPNNCGQYLNCINGYGIPGSCAENYYYNIATGNCENSNPCIDNGSVNNPALPPSTNSVICLGKPSHSFVSDGATCYGYYYCASSESVGVWGSCYLGQFFDERFGYCNSPASTNCPYNRCQNTNLTFAANGGSSCLEYIYCPSGTIWVCPFDYPYIDEIHGVCVSSKPSYAVCQ